MRTGTVAEHPGTQAGGVPARRRRPRLVVGMSGSSAPQLYTAILLRLRELATVESHLLMSEGARRSWATCGASEVTVHRRLGKRAHGSKSTVLEEHGTTRSRGCRQ